MRKKIIILYSVITANLLAVNVLLYMANSFYPHWRFTDGITPIDWIYYYGFLVYLVIFFTNIVFPFYFASKMHRQNKETLYSKWLIYGSLIVLLIDLSEWIISIPGYLWNTDWGITGTIAGPWGGIFSIIPGIFLLVGIIMLLYKIFKARGQLNDRLVAIFPEKRKRIAFWVMIIIITFSIVLVLYDLA